MHEGDEPDVVVDLPHTHLLSREHVAEIDLRPFKQIRPQVVDRASQLSR
jgi:hypothetical protein